MKRLAYLIPLSIILMGCCKAATPQIEIAVHDENSNDLLAGETPSTTHWAWFTDAFTVPQPLEIVSTAQGSAFLMNPYDITSGQTFYIVVDSTDIDTLTLEYEIKGWNCNQQVKINEITYNGNTFSGSKRGQRGLMIKY